MTRTERTSRPQGLPPLPEDAHKGTAGRVMCLCGSATMPGAAVLVARAAQRAGAGLVTLGCFERELLTVVPAAVPEAIYLDLSRSRDLIAGRLPAPLAARGSHARLVGPGLGQGGRTRQLVRSLLEDEYPGPMVLDADGLNVVGAAIEAFGGFHGTLVLTPHPGEGARLLGRERLPADGDGRLECALEIARRSGGICCLKGNRTVVTDGERVFVNTTGSAALATAGAGDVLAGLLVAYLARTRSDPHEGWTPFEAACAAVYVHGLAGDLAAAERGQAGTVASDVIELLPSAQLSLERAG